MPEKKILKMSEYYLKKWVYIAYIYKKDVQDTVVQDSTKPV